MCVFVCNCGMYMARLCCSWHVMVRTGWFVPCLLLPYGEGGGGGGVVINASWEEDSKRKREREGEKETEREGGRE